VVKVSAKNRLKAKIKAIMPFLIIPKDDKVYTPTEKIEFKAASNRHKSIIASRHIDGRSASPRGTGTILQQRSQRKGGRSTKVGGRVTKVHRGTNFMGSITPKRPTEMKRNSPPKDNRDNRIGTIVERGGGVRGQMEAYKKRTETFRRGTMLK